MFLGEFSHNLDSKGRVTIPAKFRHQLMPGLVVTRNPTGGCLMADAARRMAECCRPS